MKIVEPRVRVLAYSQLMPNISFDMDGTSPSILGAHTKRLKKDPCSELSRITEACGRISWKSEDKASPGSADAFCVKVVNIRKDESIAEHASVTMVFVTDRITSHQIVRHRIAAYTQESTHYINYGKRGDEIEVCRPLGIPQFGDDGLTTDAFDLWLSTCKVGERTYFELLRQGIKHYHARFALPMCLKTEIAVTYNLRTWLHVLGLRTTPNNTPEIVHVMRLAAGHMSVLCPEIFSEFYPKIGTEEHKAWLNGK